MAKAKAGRTKAKAGRKAGPPRKRPVGKRWTADNEFWGSRLIPIELLKQLVALQDVRQARAPLGALEGQLSIREDVILEMTALPTSDNLRGRFSAAELEALEEGLKASTAKNAKALTAGFGDQVHKFFTNISIIANERNLPQLRRLPRKGDEHQRKELKTLNARHAEQDAKFQAPGGVELAALGFLAVCENLRDSPASVDPLAVYSPARPWELKRAVAKNAGLADERSVRKFKRSQPNHIDLETVAEGALRKAAKPERNKPT